MTKALIISPIKIPVRRLTDGDFEIQPLAGLWLKINSYFCSTHHYKFNIDFIITQITNPK